MFIFVLLFKHIVPGILLLSIQQVLSLQVHSAFSLPDVLYIYILLLLYFNEEQNPWIFIAAFVLSLIQEYNSGQIIGITSLYFLLFSYFYSRISNLFSYNTFFIVIAVSSYIAWICFEILMHFILGFPLPVYFFSVTMLIKFGINIIIIMVFYFFLSVVLSKKDSRYEE